MPKIYRPFHQLPYCCVPATLQWILYRRGLDIMDQEAIGAALGLRMPERFRYMIRHQGVMIVPDDSNEFGTQILTEKYSINAFFEKNAIPLKMSNEYKFETADALEEFILHNIDSDRDIILRFNNAIYKGDKGVGHFALIVSYDKVSRTVEIGDADPPFFKTIEISRIFESISDRFDGLSRGLFEVEQVVL